MTVSAECRERGGARVSPGDAATSRPRPVQECPGTLVFGKGSSKLSVGFSQVCFIYQKLVVPNPKAKSGKTELPFPGAQVCR